MVSQLQNPVCGLALFPGTFDNLSQFGTLRLIVVVFFLKASQKTKEKCRVN